MSKHLKVVIGLLAIGAAVVAVGLARHGGDTRGGIRASASVSPTADQDGTASLDQTVAYLRAHGEDILTACDTSESADARGHVGEPPPTTAESGLPQENGMQAWVGPGCQAGYVSLSDPGQNGVSEVRLTPSPDAPVAGYLVQGVTGWIPAADFPKYDVQTLQAAMRKLRDEPLPADAHTRPTSEHP